MGLRRVKGNALLGRAAEGLHFFHQRQCRAVALGQAREQRGHQRIGLRAVHGAHHADARIAGAHRLRMQGLHVGAADVAQIGLGGLAAIGVLAVHGFAKGTRRHGGWPGVGLFDAGNHLGPVALPQLVGKSRFAQLARGQGAGLGQHIGVAQAAQRKGQAVTARVGRERRAQIGPGFAQRVLVERALAGSRFDAVARGRRHHSGQTGFAHRAAPVAGVKVELHIDHCDARALHQIDLGAAGVCPVFYGQGGPGCGG